LKVGNSFCFGGEHEGSRLEDSMTYSAACGRNTDGSITWSADVGSPAIAIKGELTDPIPDGSEADVQKAVQEAIGKRLSTLFQCRDNYIAAHSDVTNLLPGWSDNERNALQDIASPIFGEQAYSYSPSRFPSKEALDAVANLNAALARCYGAKNGRFSH